VDDLSLGNEGLGFEVLASSLRADLSDTKAFLAALAEKLGGALPQQCAVEWKGGGLFSKEKHVHRVTVELGENRYAIEHAGHGVRASRARVVRGISLKTEELPVDQWIDDLSRDLAAHAARNAQARMALERLLS
jgi:hypothetical protein